MKSTTITIKELKETLSKFPDSNKVVISDNELGNTAIIRCDPVDKYVAEFWGSDTVVICGDYRDYRFL